MRCFATRAMSIGLLAIALAGFAPASGIAQTPAAATPIVATPQPGPGIQVTILADTGDLPPLSVDGTPTPVQASHRLVRITMQPELGFLTGASIESALIAVESGSIVVSTTNNPAVVNVANGEPIMAEDGAVLCEQGLCDVAAGQTVVLGPGNGFTMAQDVIQVDTVGNEPAVFQMSVVFSSDGNVLCWICPTT